MRQSKFRAWNPIEEKFEYWTLNELCYNSNRPDLCLEEWQEFTGLLDTNGKEIYEGDILKPTTREGLWSDQVGKLHIVRDIREPFGNCNLFEVIGNIYENPELLTSSK